MVKEGKYLYGIIKADSRKKFGPIGIGEGKEVYTVVHQGIAAVVSESSVAPFYSTYKETILRNLATYQAVIEEVMKDYNVVPMKFGSMVKDEEELKKILERGYVLFENTLRAMKGKIELDVVASWSELDSTLKDTGEEDKIKRFKKEIETRKDQDQIYRAKIELGKMVKASLDKRRDKCATEILDILKDQTEDFSPHDLMNDSMIMNTAFLINKSKEDEFNGKVRQLDEKYKDKINFRIVGPLPPYSFSTLEIKKANFEEIDDARKIFGFGKEATLSQIKEAYRKLSKEFHPDKYPGDPGAQKRFENITGAYQILTDYCQTDRCSFKEAEVKDFITVKAL